MKLSDTRFRVLACVTLAGLAGSALAGLYPPAAPPGSAFVRVFNATTQPKVTGKIGDKPVPEAAPRDASSYIFLAPGEYPASIGSTQENLKLERSRCYTVAVAPDGLHPFDQDCFNSQLKSLLSVYNLIDGTTLSLKMADGTTVIDNVSANASGHREVNPVKANLAVFNGATKLADAKPVSLERGKVSSLFITGTAAEPTLTWVVN
jgi:alginate O-acetyltransferase complex protein AlgF